MSSTTDKCKALFQEAFETEGSRVLRPLGSGEVAEVRLRRTKVLVRVHPEGFTILDAKGSGGNGVAPVVP